MSTFWTRILRSMIVLTIIIGFVSSAGAQTLLTYGSGVSGTITAIAPLAFYPFSGTADDLVTVQVIALTPDLNPSVSLNAPTGQQLAFSSSDPFNPGVARISLRLPQSGVFTLLVNSSTGSVGDFAIRLDGAPAPDVSELDDDAPADETIDEQSTSLFYSVAANPETPLNVTVTTTTAGFAFSVAMRTQQGQTLATVTGSDALPAILTLPLSSETYELEVRPNVAGTQGDVSVALALVAPTTVEDEPEATEEVPEATAEPDEPATTEEPTADATDSAPEPATTEEADGPTVTEETTESSATVQSSATPTATASSTVAPGTTATATASATATTSATATATSTPSYTPTTQPSATPTPSYTPTTPPPPQLAPEDSRFNNPLMIPLDSTASVLDFVSFPDGDVEDRVRYEVTGMNPNAVLSGGRARLVISATCFGENTDQIQFFTGGQTYSCGQTLVEREVTANSDTGSVIITAVGGEGTYVQWVLTGTATRVN